MIAVTGDPSWESRLRELAARGGWSWESYPDLSMMGRTSRESMLVVLDGLLVRNMPGLRARCPSATVVLALTSDEMTPSFMKSALASGVDEVVGKDWTADRIFQKLSTLKDQSLAGEVRLSSDGMLKAEKRSHRGYVSSRGRWKDLNLHPAEFVLLWRLLEREGHGVSREELLAALRSALGRDFEAATVARRALTLRKALSGWKGKLESVRGGFYRLIPQMKEVDNGNTRGHR